MKNIHTIITACFTLSLLFVSCIEDEQLVQLGQGTLSLSGLELQAVATEQVATRALSEDFTVQVYKEGAITPDTTFTYQSTQQSGSKVTLNVGNYYLKAYNAAHADGDYTRAVYCYQSEVFTIKEDWITYVNAYVPMVNYAVRLALPATFDIFLRLTLSPSRQEEAVCRCPATVKRLTSIFPHLPLPSVTRSPPSTTMASGRPIPAPMAIGPMMSRQAVRYSRERCTK